MSLIIKARNIRLDYAGRDVLDIDERKRLFLTVKFPVRDASNLIIGIGGQSTEITQLIS